ncbi:MAG: Xaa-Pro peptidase family protein, partial [Syntrophorhabdaceae bacterium]|nr:Xaa-Pro peptidase family protein [Syntrophorhabdaceae bacterium]
MRYAPKDEIDTRISKLKTLMEKASLDGAFFHYKIDYYYLSGTMQDSLLFVPLNSEPLLFVKREITRARRESPLANVISYRSIKDIPQYLKPMKRVGMQLDVIPYNDVIRFKDLLGDVEFVDCSPLTKELRKRKSPFEIGLMEKAAEISKKVYAKVPEFLREGATEIEVGGHMEAYAKSLGHEGLLRVRSLNYEAYTWHILSGRTGSIVSQSDSPMGGFGLSPAFPVGASFKKIKRNEPILVDFGICYHGYQVDQTRMYAIGAIPDIFARAYDACKEIHDRVLEKVVEGYTSKELFEYSKELGDKLGYGDYFLGYKPHKVRFLGHGIGIELAEFPYIAATHTYPI